MLDKDFEERLQGLKKRFLENSEIPSDSKKQDAGEYFMSLSNEEKEKKVTEFLDLMTQKQALIGEQLEKLKAENAEPAKIEELEEHLDAIEAKRLHAEQKLRFIQSGEIDPAKKEKLKRQLAELEIKRCKATLAKKNCSKLDNKIAEKKELFKKLMHQ